MIATVHIGPMGKVTAPQTIQIGDKQYSFSQTQVVKPSLLSGELEMVPSNYRPRVGATVSVKVNGEQVEQVLEWNEDFIAKALRPYRLMFRKGNLKEDAPAHNYVPPEYKVIWLGYAPWSDYRLRNETLRDHGCYATYFEQYNPETDEWEKIDDPRT